MGCGEGVLGLRALYYVLLAVAVSNISTASVLVRLSEVHGFAAASWRLLLGFLLTALVLAVTGSWRQLASLRARDLGLALAGGVALALHFDLWMLSLSHLNIAPSVVIVDSYPALLAIVGRLVFGERYTRLQLYGAGVAMLGVASLAIYSSGAELAPPGGDPLLGSLLALGGMVGVAVYFIIGKDLRGRYDTWAYTSLVYGFGALASIAFSAALEVQLYGYPRETYAYLLLLALLPMLGGHTILNYLLPRLSLLAVTVPVLGEPVGASILGWVILGEPVGAVEAALMAVTLGGIALVLLGERAGRGSP